MSGKKPKLTKVDILNMMVNVAKLNPETAFRLYGEFFHLIKDSILSGKIVELRGFGSFSVKIRKGRARARNPRTGEEVSVANHGVVVFRPGKELRTQAWPLTK